MTTRSVSPIQAAFRETKAVVCTPVAVITTRRHDLPYGTTVSAFAALSMDPPMVLVALDRNSQLLEIVRATGTFGVNVLGSDQALWRRTSRARADRGSSLASNGRNTPACHAFLVRQGFWAAASRAWSTAAITSWCSVLS